jgi:hypothetical protein
MYLQMFNEPRTRRSNKSKSHHGTGMRCWEYNMTKSNLCLRALLVSYPGLIEVCCKVFVVTRAENILVTGVKPGQ